MDSLATKVSHCVVAIKKKTLGPYYDYVATNKGHAFLKKAGPIIACGFTMTQALHAILFY